MFTIPIIFTILTTHYVADFLIQSKWMYENKSKDSAALVLHTTAYTLAWSLLLTSPAFNIPMHNMLMFLLITWGCHTIIDGITAAINTELQEEGRSRAILNWIGFDQLLHYGQLFLTWESYISTTP